MRASQWRVRTRAPEHSNTRCSGKTGWIGQKVVAMLREDINIPIQPFCGTMGVATDEPGPIGSLLLIGGTPGSAGR